MTPSDAEAAGVSHSRVSMRRSLSLPHLQNGWDTRTPSGGYREDPGRSPCRVLNKDSVREVGRGARTHLRLSALPPPPAQRFNPPRPQATCSHSNPMPPKAAQDSEENTTQRRYILAREGVAYSFTFNPSRQSLLGMGRQRDQRYLRE